MFDRSKCIESLLDLLSKEQISGSELRLYTKDGIEIQVRLAEIERIAEVINLFPIKNDS